jgi:hypothetical protein
MVGPEPAAACKAISPEPCGDPGPRLVPAVGADDGAQGQHRVDAAGRPVYAAALEADLDDDLVGDPGEAAGDRVASRAEVSWKYPRWGTCAGRI